MSVVYKVARNLTLPIGAVILVASLVGLVAGAHLLKMAGQDALDARVTGPLSHGWDLMVTIVAVLGIVVGGWYVAEQIYNRRKFEKLIATDKRSEFTSSRKKLEDLSRRLPEHYKPRIAEKEATFKSRR